jgi:tetratricopeptide (TPR) repeat protein
LAEAARVLAYFTEDIDCAIAMIERALVLNPSYARGWFWNGWIRMLAGQPNLAIGHLQTASRLNPRHRAYSSSIGMAHFLARRNDRADCLAS